MFSLPETRSQLRPTQAYWPKGSSAKHLWTPSRVSMSLEAAQIRAWNEGQGASWVRTKSAGSQLGHHPSPDVGLRMAGSGMLRTPPWPAEVHQSSGDGSCWAAQVPGNRSTIQRCSDDSAGGRQLDFSVKSSKKLRLKSLPYQN